MTDSVPCADPASESTQEYTEYVSDKQVCFAPQVSQRLWVALVAL